MTELKLRKKLNKLYKKYDKLNRQLHVLRAYGGTTTEIINIQKGITKTSEHIGYVLINLRNTKD